MLWTFGAGRSNAGVNGTVLHGVNPTLVSPAAMYRAVARGLGRFLFRRNGKGIPEAIIGARAYRRRNWKDEECSSPIFRSKRNGWRTSRTSKRAGLIRKMCGKASKVVRFNCETT